MLPLVILLYPHLCSSNSELTAHERCTATRVPLLGPWVHNLRYSPATKMGCIQKNLPCCFRMGVVSNSSNTKEQRGALSFPSKRAHHCLPGQFEAEIQKTCCILRMINNVLRTIAIGSRVHRLCVQTLATYIPLPFNGSRADYGTKVLPVLRRRVYFQ